MKLPTRLSIALGTLVLGLEALAAETTMSHPLHVASVLVGGFVLYLVSPAEGASSAPAPAAIAPTPGANVKPEPPPV